MNEALSDYDSVELQQTEKIVSIFLELAVVAGESRRKNL